MQSSLDNLILHMIHLHYFLHYPHTLLHLLKIFTEIRHPQMALDIPRRSVHSIHSDSDDKSSQASLNIGRGSVVFIVLSKKLIITKGIFTLKFEDGSLLHWI